MRYRTYIYIHTHTHTHTHTKNCHGFLQSHKLNGVTVQLFWSFHEWHDWKYAALDREWLGQVGSVHQAPCLLITTNKQCSWPFSLVPRVLWQSFWVQLSAWAGHWNVLYQRCFLLPWCDKTAGGTCLQSKLLSVCHTAGSSRHRTFISVTSERSVVNSETGIV
jgi:hypothetical protein